MSGGEELACGRGAGLVGDAQSALRFLHQVRNEGQELHAHGRRLRLEPGRKHVQRAVCHDLADGAVQIGGRSLVVMGEFQGVEADGA